MINRYIGREKKFHSRLFYWFIIVIAYTTFQKLSYREAEKYPSKSKLRVKFFQKEIAKKNPLQNSKAN